VSDTVEHFWPAQWQRLLWFTGLVAVACVASVALAKPLLMAPNYDLVVYVGPWLEYIRAHGGLLALGDGFANYTPAYLYLLVAADAVHLPVPDFALIKLANIPALVFTAAAVFALVSHFNRNIVRASIAAAGVFFLPTVFANAFVWGQADANYAAFVLASVLMVLKKRPNVAVLLFGCAVAVKLQGIFIAPFLLLMVFQGLIPWRALLLAPLPYLAMILPPALMGRPLAELFLVYLDQAHTYRSLSMNAPNFYYVLQAAIPVGPRMYVLITLAGLALAAAVGAGVSGTGLLLARVTDRQKLILAAFCLALMPYVIPKMHDRYWFPAELALYVLAFLDRRFIAAVVAIQVASLLAYVPPLAPYFGYEWWRPYWRWGLVVAALLNAGLLAYLLVILRDELRGAWRWPADLRHALRVGRAAAA
jgi:Gpi18-like mannosyltransferase